LSFVHAEFRFLDRRESSWLAIRPPSVRRLGLILSKLVSDYEFRAESS